ncbi:hypothetical protein [Kosmotoga pacifica]|nr:hypothetical protein [Kosmotoga pacifica]
MYRRKKGNSIILGISLLMLLLLALMSTYSLSLVREASIVLHLRLENTLKYITVESALKVLAFSRDHQKPVELELNGYLLKTYKDGNKWYIKIEKDGIREIYSE